MFVLDGVLIGAGDQDYLALAGLAAAGVFAVGAALVIAQHGGLVALWLAFSVWLAGPVRHPDPAGHGPRSGWSPARSGR